MTARLYCLLNDNQSLMDVWFNSFASGPFKKISIRSDKVHVDVDRFICQSAFTLPISENALSTFAGHEVTG